MRDAVRLKTKSAVQVKGLTNKCRGEERNSRPGFDRACPHPAIFRYNSRMALSARNQFPGKITSIKLRAVMAEIAIDIGGGHQIVSLISASSAKRLKLKKGSSAVAVIKATEVIISTDDVDDAE